MAFRPLQPNQQANVPLTGRIELNQLPPPSGFTPLDAVAASRVRPALTLEQAIAEKNAGVFPPQSQPLAAFARGALEAALAGTTEAAGSLAGANPQFDPNSPQFTDPNAFATGQTVGSFLPLGRIAKGGVGLLNAIGRGARLGGLYGAGQGVSGVAQGEDPTLLSALEEGTSGALTGAAMGSVLPAIPGVAIKLQPTKQNILSDVLKISGADEGKMARSSSGGYARASEKVTPFIKEKGVEGFIDASEKALDKEASTFRPIIEKAPPSSVNPDNIYAIADAELAKLEPNPETRNQLLLNSGEFLSDLTEIKPSNLLSYASKSNREIGRIYKNPSSPITSGELAAKEAVRDAYSQVIRKILEDAGEDPGVYSGYGAIKELSSELGKNYLKAGEKLSAQKGKSFIQNTIEGLEVGGGGLNIGRAAQASMAKLTEGEKGRLDRQINSLNKTLIPLLKRESTDKTQSSKLEFLLRRVNEGTKGTVDPIATLQEALSLVGSSEQ